MGYKFNPFTGNFDTTDSPNGVFDSVEVNGDVTLDDGGSFTTTLQTITPTANRTVSIPNATGTLALVAGSSGQLLYNNAGANAGVSTFTADSSGRLTNSASSASGFPVKLWNGTIFAGATPHVLVQPTGASTPTSTNAWSANGTALAVNTAAGFTGNLLDLQVNGTRQLKISSNGSISGVAGVSQIRFGTSEATGNSVILYGYQWSLEAYSSISVNINSTLAFGWATGTYTTPDLQLWRDAANTLAQRNGTNAQVFRCYGTYTDASNYVRASLSSTSTAVTLAAETAGTGADDIPLNLTAAGTGTVKVNSNLELADAKDIVLATTTGTKIGTSTSQKLGFYNKTPVVQPTAVADITTTATAGTLPTPDGTVTIADAATPTVTELLEYCVELEAKLEAALGRLRDLGLIAT